MSLMGLVLTAGAANASAKIIDGGYSGTEELEIKALANETVKIDLKDVGGIYLADGRLVLSGSRAVAELLVDGGVETEDPDQLTMTAVVLDGETVTINRMTFSENSVIYWGDGESDVLTADSTASFTHTYTTGGSYSIVAEKASKITQIDLRDAKLYGFDTAQLQTALITYFRFAIINESVINTEHMTGWPITDTVGIYSCPTSTAITYDSAVFASRVISNFYIFGNLNYVSMSVDTSHISLWNPGSFYLQGLSAEQLTVSNISDFSGWTNCKEAHFVNNNLLAADVDKILQGLWLAFPSRTATGGTINVGGNNEAPNGAYHPANPPTSGKEFAYELLNDSQNINPTKKWATITVTGGLP